MPASRTSDVVKLQSHMDRLSLHNAVEARSMPAAATPPKKKKAPNAFILFRSHVIAERLFPNDMTHQNDISREVARLWREQSIETREYFQSLAEATKRRMQLEGTISESPNRNKKKASTKRRSSLPTQTTPAPYPPTPPLTPELVRDSPKVAVDELHSPALLSEPLVEHKPQVQNDHHIQSASSWTHAWDSTSFQWMADDFASTLSLGSWCSSSEPISMPYMPNLDGWNIDWEAILATPEDANLNVPTH